MSKIKTTKKQQVINHFIKHPLSTPKVVSEKFSMALPAVYTLRKQALAQFIERQNADIPEVVAAPVQDVDWKDMYEKEKRRSEMWVAKYEKDIGPLEYAVPVAAPVIVETPQASTRQVGGDHYVEMGVQPWDVVDTWPRDQRIGYYRGGALKYLMRMGSKDESPIEVAKGQHYIQKLLEVLNESE
jgi:hypothetical protein